MGDSENSSAFVYESDRCQPFKSREVRTWFAPDGFEVTSCTMHAQPRGEWQGQDRAANGLHYLEHGEFRVVDVPERLVFTLTQIEAGRIVLESLVTVTFTSLGL